MPIQIIALENLKNLVDDFFADTTRTRDETREALEELSDHIQGYLDTLD